MAVKSAEELNAGAAIVATVCRKHGHMFSVKGCYQLVLCWLGFVAWEAEYVEDAGWLCGGFWFAAWIEEHVEEAEFTLTYNTCVYMGFLVIMWLSSNSNTISSQTDLHI